MYALVVTAKNVCALAHMHVLPFLLDYCHWSYFSKCFLDVTNNANYTTRMSIESIIDYPQRLPDAAVSDAWITITCSYWLAGQCGGLLANANRAPREVRKTLWISCVTWHTGCWWRIQNWKITRTESDNCCWLLFTLSRLPTGVRVKTEVADCYWSNSH